MLTRKVIGVIDDLSVGIEFTDTLTGVTTLLFLAILIGSVFVDIGNIGFLIVDLDDFGCISCFVHSHNCNYVAEKSQALNDDQIHI